MRELPEASVDAIVTDPPYGLEFMGRQWDHGVPGIPFWLEAIRVLKPGGYLLAFGGTRTFHRLACAIEDAGFEIRDSIAWLYGSGFPKSLDVGKAMDKAAGAKRTVVLGPKPGHEDFVERTDAHSAGGRSDGWERPWREDPEAVKASHMTLAPVTDAAATWEGWGTALKPAHEPIVVARKPLQGTVAANVLEHGTGAMNIAACRVGVAGRPLRIAHGQDTPGKTTYGSNGPGGGSHAEGTTDLGRWPPNVLLDEDQAAELDAESGTIKSSGHYAKGSRPQGAKEGAASIPIDGVTSASYDDSGGASRFFPAFENGRDGEPSAERRYADEGGTNFAPLPGKRREEASPSDFFPTFRYQAKAPSSERPKVDGVSHPTVKPLALMRWLIKLVTPPGGVVLDPFAGSGATLEAAVEEGFDAIGIEQEATYLPLIQARLDRIVPRLL